MGVSWSHPRTWNHFKYSDNCLTLMDCSFLPSLFPTRHVEITLLWLLLPEWPVTVRRYVAPSTEAHRGAYPCEELSSSVDVLGVSLDVGSLGRRADLYYCHILAFRLLQAEPDLVTSLLTPTVQQPQYGSERWKKEPNSQGAIMSDPFFPTIIPLFLPCYLCKTENSREKQIARKGFLALTHS